MSTNNQPDTSKVTTADIVDACMTAVAFGYAELYTLATQWSVSDFEHDIASKMKTFEDALREYSRVNALIRSVAYTKARVTKESVADKKSHDEVNKDLGSTVWIDEQLEFTLPEQPTEEPKKLKLKHGKLYVARNGRIVKAIAKPPGSDEWYPFYARPLTNASLDPTAYDYSVTDNGDYWAEGSQHYISKHDLDIIAEHAEPDPTKPAAKFEVGNLYLTRDGEVVRIEEGVFFGHSDPSLIGNEPLIARCVDGEVKKGWFVQDGGKFLLTGEEHPRDIVSEITDPVPTPIGPDGSLLDKLTAEILATTHVIEYSPNCAQRFLIRIPGYGKPLIDKRRLGTTGDAIGYGNNPEDAFKQALAKREEQKGARQ